MMTKEQFSRANASLYPVVMTLYTVIIALGIVNVIDSYDKIQGVIQLVCGIGFMIANTIIYKKYRDDKRGATYTLVTGTIMYIIVMLVNIDNGTYVYAFPFLCICIIYLEKKYVIGGGIATMAGIAIHAVKLGIMGTLNFDVLVFCTVGAGLIIYGAWRVCILLTAFNAENAEVQAESYKVMLNVADELITHVNDANDKLYHTIETVDSSKTSMEEIANSTENTAEAVQQQALMCTEIRNHTENAENKMEHMLANSNKVMETVKEGAELVDGLKEQAENVVAAGKEAANASSRLNERVDMVRGIISTILDISSQTNLLALNASIEAARAGEAGKGFAVVADEIRQLSEQTKDATTKITEIINGLNEEVGKTIENVETSSEAIKKQNEFINVTQDKFESINSEVGKLNGTIDEIEEVMNLIISSTDTITDNISQLSATSEEIAAASEQSVTLSEDASSKTHELLSIMKDTQKQALELKTYQAEA